MREISMDLHIKAYEWLEWNLDGETFVFDVLDVKAMIEQVVAQTW